MICSKCQSSDDSGICDMCYEKLTAELETMSEEYSACRIEHDKTWDEAKKIHAENKSLKEEIKTLNQIIFQLEKNIQDLMNRQEWSNKN